jgi:hypothetical protein
VQLLHLREALDARQPKEQLVVQQLLALLQQLVDKVVPLH